MNCGIALPLMRFQCSLHLRIHGHCLLRFALSDICHVLHVASKHCKRNAAAAADYDVISSPLRSLFDVRTQETRNRQPEMLYLVLLLILVLVLNALQ